MTSTVTEQIVNKIVATGKIAEEYPKKKKIRLAKTQCETNYLPSDSWKLRKLSMNVNVAIFLKKQNEKKSSDLVGGTKILPSDDAAEIEKILLNFCDDCDGRVRLMAAEHLATVIPLVESSHRTLYVPLCELLNDACPSVRSQGMRLIHAIAESHSDALVPGPNKNADIRLVDDAFSRLCNAMHDTSVEVRTEAAKLLGTMRDVSEKFLAQTLDKKLMSQLKYLKNKEPRYAKFFPSEWSTGQTFGEDATAEKIDEDLAALIPSGACGAFVTGLEDEYLAVRSASIDAVCHLSQQSPSFANRALDFLADMFNDEIEDVRLNAIKSLRRLCQRIVLKDDQMETILSALDDASSDSREALRDLLSTCTLHSVFCLKSTMDALLNNLKRYPVDKFSIWNCAKKLGLNHSFLVQPLVLDLLGYHLFFDLPETSLNDPFYICKLLLVLNAASRCPAIKSLFLPQTWRHYDYLRNSSPNLTPSLEPFDDDFVDDKSGRLIDFLGRNTETTLCMAMQSGKESKCDLLKLTLKNLDRICKYSPDDLAKFSFLRLFCSSLLKFYSTLPMLNSLATKNAESGAAWKIFKEIYIDTFKMNQSWNLSTGCHEMVLALRLRILCELANFNPEARPVVNIAVQELQATLNEKDSNLLGANFSRLIEFTENLLNQAPIVQRNLVEKSIEISEPDRQSDRVVRFAAGLIAAVPFSCIFKNFDQSEFDNLRIRVTYPDGRCSLQRIRRSHVKEIAVQLHRLRTETFISDVVWTDVSVVELSLIHVLPLYCTPLLGADENFVVLCDPIPVRIYPKQRC